MFPVSNYPLRLSAIILKAGSGKHTAVYKRNKAQPFDSAAGFIPKLYFIPSAGAAPEQGRHARSTALGSRDGFLVSF